MNGGLGRAARHGRAALSAGGVSRHGLRKEAKRQGNALSGGGRMTAPHHPHSAQARVASPHQVGPGGADRAAADPPAALQEEPDAARRWLRFGNAGQPRGRRPHRRRAARRHGRGRFPGPLCRRPRLVGHLQRGPGDGRGRPLDRLGGEPGARCPLSLYRGAVPRPLSGRVRGPHGPCHQSAGPDLRHGPGHPRDRPEGRCGGRHLRAGSLGADLHVPTGLRVRHEHPRRRHRGRLERPRLHPGRPLPVQRQEIRR